MLNFPRVLLLNYSYEPIMIVSIKKAIILYILNKIDIVEKSDNNINVTASVVFYLNQNDTIDP